MADHIEVEVLPLMREYLEDLLKTGLWGRSIEEVALRLLEQGIKDEIATDHIRQRQSRPIPRSSRNRPRDSQILNINPPSRPR